MAARCSLVVFVMAKDPYFSVTEINASNPLAKTRAKPKKSKLRPTLCSGDWSRMNCKMDMVRDPYLVK